MGAIVSLGAIVNFRLHTNYFFPLFLLAFSLHLSVSPIHVHGVTQLPLKLHLWNEEAHVFFSSNIKHNNT